MAASANLMYLVAMMPDPDLLEFGECACFAVQRAARSITRHYDRHLRPAGLSATQFTLLRCLPQSGRLRQSSLAHFLGLDRSTLSRTLRPLLAKGLVASERGEDARRRELAITEEGAAAIRAALPGWRVAQKTIGSQLDRSTHRSLDMAVRIALFCRPPRRFARP